MSAPLSTPAVLVTGATGFIGREVARRLLAGGRHVVALARRRGRLSALDRVTEALDHVPAPGRLGVVDGDLTLPGCGLDDSTWPWLGDTIDTVIHCAGDTSFFPEKPAPFRAGHIDGPLTLLHGLGAGRLRRWAHLSTAYVCGRRSGSIFERDGNTGQEFHNPYEQVKLESEMAIRSAGVELTGLRVGLSKTLIKQGRIGEARRALHAVLDEKEPRNPADWTLKDGREARQLLESIKGRS